MKERRLIVSYLDEKKKDTKLKISQSAIKMFEKKESTRRLSEIL